MVRIIGKTSIAKPISVSDVKCGVDNQGHYTGVMEVFVTVLGNCTPRAIFGGKASFLPPKAKGGYVTEIKYMNDSDTSVIKYEFSNTFTKNREKTSERFRKKMLKQIDKQNGKTKNNKKPTAKPIKLSYSYNSKEEIHWVTVVYDGIVVEEYGNNKYPLSYNPNVIGRFTVHSKILFEPCVKIPKLHHIRRVDVKDNNTTEITYSWPWYAGKFVCRFKNKILAQINKQKSR